jgi:hypothetical protein
MTQIILIRHRTPCVVTCLALGNGITLARNLDSDLQNTTSACNSLEKDLIRRAAARWIHARPCEWPSLAVSRVSPPTRQKSWLALFFHVSRNATFEELLSCPALLFVYLSSTPISSSRLLPFQLPLHLTRSFLYSINQYDFSSNSF